ncbi:hypothetical protein BJ508DRAFT_415829 [Ascobolus immersus RN42]|uniref:Uncharacterized protein n=1 Tax=Ascobolus immersus RN42 TaxID=1160509 RepID=A0A3N4I0P0_ASCIM|nr:hypothetical protein BJ508DRAFT_415829 [Ascobolus immersus RN42]
MGDSFLHHILARDSADPHSAAKESRERRTKITYSIVATVLVVLLLSGTAWWCVHERRKKQKYLAAHLKSKGWSLGRLRRRKDDNLPVRDDSVGLGGEERVQPAGAQFVWHPELRRYEVEESKDGVVGGRTAVISKGEVEGSRDGKAGGGVVAVSTSTEKGNVAKDTTERASLWPDMPDSARLPPGASM